MGKRETKSALTDTKAARDLAQKNYGEARQESTGAIGGLQEGLPGAREEIAQGYRNIGNLGNEKYTPAQVGMPRDINVDELKTSLGRFREFGNTGGFTPEREASIMQNVQGLKEFGRTGGLSQENVERMRGLGGFDEFSKTGGYTPEAIANIKAQALSPISSYATGTRDELARRQAASGGYGPGFDAASRQLQRDTARGIADTSLAANVGIQDRVNAGRQWGIQGLAGAEAGLAGLQSANKFQGMQAAGNMELQMQDTISKYRAMGMSMEQATAKAISDFDAMNVGNQMQAGMFNAGAQNDAGYFNAQNLNNQRLQALGGLQGLYNTDVGQLQNERDRRNALLGGQTTSNLGYLGNQSQLAMQPGIGGNLMNLAGAAAGTGAAYFGARVPGMAAQGARAGGNMGQMLPAGGALGNYSELAMSGGDLGEQQRLMGMTRPI